MLFFAAQFWRNYNKHEKYRDKKVNEIISVMDNQRAGDEGLPSTMNCNGCTWKMS